MAKAKVVSKEKLEQSAEKAESKEGMKIPKSKMKKLSKEVLKTLSMTKERDIAMDFATKVYEKFGKIIK